jgi:hypothetical protein
MRTLGLYANRRWFDVDVSVNATCPLCSDGLEDESHFFFDCRDYNTLRTTSTLFDKYNLKRHNLTSVISSTNADLIKSLAKFISDAFNYRRKKLLT